jgi:hypothetical protein
MSSHQQESFLLLINHLISGELLNCEESGGDDIDLYPTEDTMTDDLEFDDNEEMMMDNKANRFSRILLIVVMHSILLLR